MDRRVIKVVSLDRWNKSLNTSMSIYSKLIDVDFFNTIYNFTVDLFIRLNSGGKLIMFGNGGSAADCDHIVGEFRNRFLVDRKPAMAMSLTNSVATVTSIGNDFSYEELFSRQLLSICNEGDSIIALSTSGTSKNIKRAFVELYNEKRKLYDSVNSLLISGEFVLNYNVKNHIEIPVTYSKYMVARIQEVTMFILHMMCQFYDSLCEANNYSK